MANRTEDERKLAKCLFRIKARLGQPLQVSDQELAGADETLRALRLEFIDAGISKIEEWAYWYLCGGDSEPDLSDALADVPDIDEGLTLIRRIKSKGAVGPGPMGRTQNEN